MSVFIEVIEWLDPTGEDMIHRIPQEGSADFKLGAQLIIRDSHSSRMAMPLTRSPPADIRCPP